LLGATKVEIKWDLKGVELYNEAFVETDRGVGHAIVRKTHTNVVLIEANGAKIFETAGDRQTGRIDYSSDDIRQYRIKDFYEFARTEPIEHLSCCRDAIRLNRALAEAGLEPGVGSGFGHAFQKMPGSFVLKAKALTAAASDARMAGLSLPAMSCATSGNVGITASLPLAVVAEEFGKSEEELTRALALSFLTVVYLKSHIGRLSAICACSIAASLGVAAGAAYLMGGQLREIEMAIDSVIGSIGGILCDGAKYGCALKLSHAIGVAIESAMLLCRASRSSRATASSALRPTRASRRSAASPARAWLRRMRSWPGSSSTASRAVRTD
jgi:L-cysteine desulfidase